MLCRGCVSRAKRDCHKNLGTALRAESPIHPSSSLMPMSDSLPECFNLPPIWELDFVYDRRIGRQSERFA